MPQGAWRLGGKANSYKKETMFYFCLCVCEQTGKWHEAGRRACNSNLLWHQQGSRDRRNSCNSQHAAADRLRHTIRGGTNPQAAVTNPSLAATANNALFAIDSLSRRRVSLRHSVFVCLYGGHTSDKIRSRHSACCFALSPLITRFTVCTSWLRLC